MWRKIHASKYLGRSKLSEIILLRCSLEVDASDLSFKCDVDDVVNKIIRMRIHLRHFITSQSRCFSTTVEMMLHLRHFYLHLRLRCYICAIVGDWDVIKWRRCKDVRIILLIISLTSNLIKTFASSSSRQHLCKTISDN